VGHYQRIPKNERNRGSIPERKGKGGATTKKLEENPGGIYENLEGYSIWPRALRGEKKKNK